MLLLRLQWLLISCWCCSCWHCYCCCCSCGCCCDCYCRRCCCPPRGGRTCPVAEKEFPFCLPLRSTKPFACTCSEFVQEGRNTLRLRASQKPGWPRRLWQRSSGTVGGSCTHVVCLALLYHQAGGYLQHCCFRPAQLGSLRSILNLVFRDMASFLEKAYR